MANLRLMLKSRRPYFVVGLIVVAIAAIAVYSWLTSPTTLEYYRAVDDNTIALGIFDSGNIDNRVSGVAETPEKVTVSVVALQLTLGASGQGAIPLEVEAHLAQPLGNRAVIDASTGMALQRASCPWPAVFASPCPSAQP